jgi:hypothetical protein
MQIAPYAETLVATIYYLFRKGTSAVKGKVFYVSVRTVFADYATGEKSIAGFTHLAVVAESNYVQVYASLTARPKRCLEITDWRLICDHDSAWRDDGVAGALKKAYKLTESLAATSLKAPVNQLSVHIAIDEMEIVDLPEHRFANVARGTLTADQLLPQ